MLAGHVLDHALVAEPDDCWPVRALHHAQRERRVEAGRDESVGVGRRVLYAHAARLHEPMRDLRAVPRVHGFAESVAAAAGGRHREEREEQGSSLASVRRRRRSRAAAFHHLLAFFVPLHRYCSLVSVSPRKKQGFPRAKNSISSPFGCSLESGEASTLAEFRAGRPLVLDF